VSAGSSLCWSLNPAELIGKRTPYLAVATNVGNRRHRFFARKAKRAVESGRGVKTIDRPIFKKGKTVRF
jgi:hypothetical protein